MSTSNESAQLQQPLRGSIETKSLQLEWSEAPWDTAIYGDPVLQITGLEVRGSEAATDLTAFESARDLAGCGLVSCRLAHNRLRESMLLEGAGFRFVEMLYLPELDLERSALGGSGSGLLVRAATEADMPGVLKIAGSAFRNERFHVDPRLPADRADKRYQTWASSSLAHQSQRLFVLSDGPTLVAFFVTEDLPDGTCYWHLNAVAVDSQGKGYGRKAWSDMIRHAQAGGARRVRTSIVARNHRVLNLYAQLGFRFPPPLMTFHWVRSM